MIHVPFVHGAFDSVFIKDSALVKEMDHGRHHALLAKPKTPQRRAEQEPRGRALTSLGFHVAGQTKMHFEGGDLVVLPQGRGAFLGYGFRTQWRAAREIETFLNVPVMTLQLVDDHFYHLDTALNVLATDEGLIAFALKEAFTPDAWTKLNRHPELTRVVPVQRLEAMRFGLNWVEVGRHIFVGAPVPELSRALADYGRDVVVSPARRIQLGRRQRGLSGGARERSDVKRRGGTEV